MTAQTKWGYQKKIRPKLYRWANWGKEVNITDPVRRVWKSKTDAMVNESLWKFQIAMT